VVADGETNFEAVAYAEPSAPLGRELQLAELLRFIKHRRVTGTVWLTADVHYTFAQHYQPTRAGVHRLRAAEAFPANTLDAAFGSERVFVKAPTRVNVEIDGEGGEITVRLREIGGAVLFAWTLQPGLVGQ
jgi:alkaline phosphatase D